MAYTGGLAGALQVAMARGYFEQEGIEFQREESFSSSELLPALATGQLDAGSTTPNPALFNAIARGVQIQLALSGFLVERDTSLFPLVTRLGADGAPVVREASDLRGRRLAQNQRGAINEMALERVLAEANLQLSDVDIAVMPFPDTLGALGNGNVDAAVLVEPFGTMAELRGVGVKLRNTDELIPGTQAAVMSFSEAFARDRPDVAKRWAVAYLRGARDYVDAMEHGRDREAVVALLAQMSGLAPQVVDRAGYGTVSRDGRVNVQGVMMLLDWLVDHGYVPQRPDLAPLLDYQFADHAARVLDSRH